MENKTIPNIPYYIGEEDGVFFVTALDYNLHCMGNTLDEAMGEFIDSFNSMLDYYSKCDGLDFVDACFKNNYMIYKEKNNGN